MNKKFLMFGFILMFGFALVSASSTNLVINDLEDINFDGLTVQDYSGSNQPDCSSGLNAVFEIRSYEFTQPDFPYMGGPGDFPGNITELGSKWFWDNVPHEYLDGEVTNQLPLVLKITTDCIADIREGDFITLTYDGGQTLDVYLPEINERVFKNYFISDDGSIYHDDALTQLITAIPSIIGPKIVELASTHDYLIDISTNFPDSDYSDGTYQVQYANWGLMDSNGILVFEGTWEEIFGLYQASPIITFPNEVGEYSIFVVVTQIDMTFNEFTGNWTSGEEYIVVQEAIKINVQYSVTEPNAPEPNGFSFFSDINDWLSGLWNWIFG